MEASTIRKEMQTDLKAKIETLLSEILSDKHECRVVLKFEKSKEDKK